MNESTGHLPYHTHMAGRTKGKVLVAMSGGVDSSVAAALLLRQGYEVVGCFMRLGSPGETLEPTDDCDLDDSPDQAEPSVTGKSLRIGKQGCCSIDDAKDAQRVAAELGIPLYVLNFKHDFGRVIDYFVSEYHAGRTPNPCVRCNDWLKFGKLADYARSIDADYVASGHYARIETVDGAPALLRGVDEGKDQSYVLFGMNRSDLNHTLLPIGRYRKAEIRERAKELGLGVHDKPDSQEICFVTTGDYRDVLRQHRHSATQRSETDEPQVTPGPLLDSDGQVIGEHEGHQNYTVGQRRGVGVALGYPVYVVDKNAATNTVTLGPRDALARDGLTAHQVNWLTHHRPDIGQSMRCRAKYRYNTPAVEAEVEVTGEQTIRVRFAEPRDAIAPGQAVVCYDGDRVICGGWITQAW